MPVQGITTEDPKIYTHTSNDASLKDENQGKQKKIQFRKIILLEIKKGELLKNESGETLSINLINALSRVTFA